MLAILGLTLDELKSCLKKQNFPVFAARQIFSWIYKKEIFDFDRMTDLSRELRDFLKSNFYILSLALADKQESCDGTQKFLFGIPDDSGFLIRREGNQGIESVIIPAPRRLTACISTQAGCKFACRFCASGALGWQRNLSTGEIIEQAIYLKKIAARRLNNLVFMGIGEPLDNYDNLLKAIHILNSPYSLNIGARKMTISTCGLIPGIKRLAEENLQIELSVSLHAADNKIRDYLIPVNKKYPLDELLSACRDYFKKTKRQVTFEYVLIKGMNSQPEQAKKLTRLLAGLDAKVNLIPASPFRNEFPPPDKSDMLIFRGILLKAGIPS
ncbi:MAG: 23S rRNA (adenine(2503)-C(2))-methyltransferase RlmN, partial [Candidatus Omnitrophota bacterium]